MKWLLIAALWNTNPPQDSFRFYTQVFDSSDECEYALQYLYTRSFEKGIQAQAICKSEAQLKLLGPAY